MHDDVADLAALVEYLRLGPAHIAGNSFGGSIVLRLAGARPDLLRSLIVHEPPLIDLLADSEEGRTILGRVRGRIDAVVELLRTGDAGGGARLFVETVAFGPGAWDRLPAQMQQTIVFNAPTWLDETQDPEALRLDVSHLAPFIQPALVTRGDQSPSFFRPIVAKIVQALKRSEERTFPGAGHVPHVSHPDEYVETVLQFVQNSG